MKRDRYLESLALKLSLENNGTFTYEEYYAFYSAKRAPTTMDTVAKSEVKDNPFKDWVKRLVRKQVEKLVSDNKFKVGDNDTFTINLEYYAREHMQLLIRQQEEARL